VRVGRVTASQTRTEAPQPETHSKEVPVKRAEATKEELLVTQVVERSGAGAGVQRPGGAAVARPACARK
jgi:hypothetical protein